MNDIKITLTLNETPVYGIAHKGGRKTFEYQAFDGWISFAVQYDYDRRPLTVEAQAEDGATVELVLMSHRIELYVNGRVVDEEWPIGERLLGIDDEIFSMLPLTVEPYTEPKKEEPSVISTFEGAEGWYPEENVFVGDCMPYVRDGEYHVLYLKDRHHHKSKWSLGAHQWEHISSPDFKTWSIHPMAVPITEPWEGSICTGSWIRRGELEYLFYTVRRGKGLANPIRRSISRDGYHFEKDPNFSFSLSEKYRVGGARDPKVVRGEDGLYHMFLTTKLIAEGKGCLAHLVSEDMDNWRELDEPIYIADDGAEPECPDYFCYRGKYYLIFSLRTRAHYMISDRPFDGFVMPQNPIIPCASVPKGAIWGDKIVFAGFNRMGGYGGSLTFRTAEADEQGELIFL